MTTAYHTAISNGAVANASTVNTPLSALDTAIGLAGGGSGATEAYLLANFDAALSRPTSTPTYHGTYTNVIASMPVLWPDGSVGAYTATVINSTWEEATTWTLTHVDSSKTLRSQGLARDSNGLITTQPTYDFI